MSVQWSVHLKSGELHHASRVLTLTDKCDLKGLVGGQEPWQQQGQPAKLWAFCSNTLNNRHLKVITKVQDCRWFFTHWHSVPGKSSPGRLQCSHFTKMWTGTFQRSFSMSRKVCQELVPFSVNWQWFIEWLRWVKTLAACWQYLMCLYLWIHPASRPYSVVVLLFVYLR